MKRNVFTVSTVWLKLNLSTRLECAAVKKLKCIRIIFTILWTLFTSRDNITSIKHLPCIIPLIFRGKNHDSNLGSLKQFLFGSFFFFFFPFGIVLTYRSVCASLVSKFALIPNEGHQKTNSMDCCMLKQRSFHIVSSQRRTWQNGYLME